MTRFRVDLLARGKSGNYAGRRRPALAPRAARAVAPRADRRPRTDVRRDMRHRMPPIVRQRRPHLLGSVMHSCALLVLVFLGLASAQPESITLGCQLYTSADLVTVRGGPGEGRTACQLAMDEINASDDLLPDTKLVPMFRNTYGREQAVQDTLDLVQPDADGVVRPQTRKDGLAEATRDARGRPARLGVRRTAALRSIRPATCANTSLSLALCHRSRLPPALLAPRSRRTRSSRP